MSSYLLLSDCVLLARMAALHRMGEVEYLNFSSIWNVISSSYNLSYLTPQCWSLTFDQTGRFGGQKRR
jgi:hypothetical protein